MTLREVLHAHIPTLDAQSTVRDAVDKMDLYQFPALVVLDPNRVPTAVVTEGDVCRAASAAGSLAGIAYLPAHRFGTPEPIVAPADTEIGEAFHLMLSRGLTILPVIDDGVLAGIVLRCDLMHAMLVDSEPESPPV